MAEASFDCASHSCAVRPSLGFAFPSMTSRWSSDSQQASTPAYATSSPFLTTSRFCSEPTLAALFHAAATHGISPSLEDLRLGTASLSGFPARRCSACDLAFSLLSPAPARKQTLVTMWECVDRRLIPKRVSSSRISPSESWVPRASHSARLPPLLGFVMCHLLPHCTYLRKWMSDSCLAEAWASGDRHLLAKASRRDDAITCSTECQRTQRLA